MSILERTKPFKTLQELAASKTAEELLPSTDPYEEFHGFHEHQQKLVFRQLLREHHAALEAQKQFEHAKKDTPYVDSLLYIKRYRRILDPDMEDSEDDDEHSNTDVRPKIKKDPAMNGERIKAEFLMKWHHQAVNEVAHIDELNRRWNPLDPSRVDTSYFDVMSLCSHGTASDLAVCEYGKRMRDPPECGVSFEEHKAFYNKISSQLLYYRVSSLFGMPTPPFRKEGYKCCWWAVLVFEEENSRLEIGDYKGWANTNYRGTEEGRKSALALLNFLTSMNIPHTFDGVVCGTMA